VANFKLGPLCARKVLALEMAAKYRIAIIASGDDYLRLAHLAGATYRVNVSADIRIGIWSPRGTATSNTFGKWERDFGIERHLFPLRIVSNQKFTAQLKCQGFVNIVADLASDEIAIIVDADTYCRAPFQVSASILGAIDGGNIGIARDIGNRFRACHSNIGRKWHLPLDRRVAYVNSGVIMASGRTLDILERIRELSFDPAFLTGRYNDQKIVNFAVNNWFGARLLLLPRTYNDMSLGNGGSSMIVHLAGGAGRLQKKRRRTETPRYILHVQRCISILGRDAVRTILTCAESSQFKAPDS
jgi:hypothetical protein